MLLKRRLNNFEFSALAFVLIAGLMISTQYIPELGLVALIMYGADISTLFIFLVAVISNPAVISTAIIGVLALTAYAVRKRNKK